VRGRTRRFFIAFDLSLPAGGSEPSQHPDGANLRRRLVPAITRPMLRSLAAVARRLHPVRSTDKPSRAGTTPSLRTQPTSRDRGRQPGRFTRSAGSERVLRKGELEKRTFAAPWRRDQEGKRLAAGTEFQRARERNRARRSHVRRRPPPHPRWRRKSSNGAISREGPSLRRRRLAAGSLRRIVARSNPSEQSSAAPAPAGAAGDRGALGCRPFSRQ
jgi:hypothetical protein